MNYVMRHNLPLQMFYHVPIALLVALDQGLGAARHIASGHRQPSEGHSWQTGEARPGERRTYKDAKIT